MFASRASCSLVLLSLLRLALVSAQGSWQTLSGKAPLVIARGGFSGMFPDSSFTAYALAEHVSLPNVVLWCDVQLTKDAKGVCLPSLKLDNSTSITRVFPKGNKNYDVNGVSTNGWFSIDFTSTDLSNVAVEQKIYSRSNKFDGNFFPVLTLDEIVKEFNKSAMWLNVEHDAFYTQHNLSMRSYVLSKSQSMVINYISSPEVNFLSSIKSSIPKTTKLVFRFLEKDQVEPSTKQTYDSLSKNLTFIKTFASGILVPKDYIWPVDSSQYLLPHTTLVSDAHKQGLEIFGSNFVNDFPISYNYSFDPVDEYLNFIDNGEFSVDGFLSDFPITASAAIDCYAHLAKNAPKTQDKPLIISKFGSSGDYPGCTDLAYTKAIQDGVEVIDCPVQLSSDGIPFCMSSINLNASTNADKSQFKNRGMNVPENKAGDGIYAFSLKWNEIQTLKPVIASPWSKYTILRNPKNTNAGKFITLSEFLDLTKKTPSLSGILIGIENATYLAQKQGLSVTDAVTAALNKAGPVKHKIMIQSSNKNVLEKFKGKGYELVYKIDEEIRDIDEPALKDIAAFANSVVVTKTSVFPDNELYSTGVTEVVSKLQSHKLAVYVGTFNNEFVSQPWDFFSDGTVEINTHVNVGNVDGVITDFPKTSARFKRNRCFAMGDNVPSYMSPVQPGSLMEIITPEYLPPPEAPSPILDEGDVNEGSLPPVSAKGPPSAPKFEARATSRSKTTLTHS